MKRRLCPPASTSIRRRLLFTDPLTGTLYRLQVVACSLETWAERLRGRQGPSAARQDETTWSLAGERLQAVECVLADHLVPAREALLRAFQTPETVLQAEFEEALKDYAETRRRLDQTDGVPHLPGGKARLPGTAGGPPALAGKAAPGGLRRSTLNPGELGRIFGPIL